MYCLRAGAPYARLVGVDIETQPGAVHPELQAEFIWGDSRICHASFKAPVHLLFIVRKHLEWKDEFSGDDLSLIGKLISVAKKTAKDQKIDRAYKLIFNVGETAHFPHIHLHLLGGWQKDTPLHNI